MNYEIRTTVSTKATCRGCYKKISKNDELAFFIRGNKERVVICQECIEGFNKQFKELKE